MMPRIATPASGPPMAALDERLAASSGSPGRATCSERSATCGQHVTKPRSQTIARLVYRTRPVRASRLRPVRPDVADNPSKEKHETSHCVHRGGGGRRPRYRRACPRRRPRPGPADSTSYRADLGAGEPSRSCVRSRRPAVRGRGRHRRDRVDRRAVPAGPRRRPVHRRDDRPDLPDRRAHRSPDHRRRRAAVQHHQRRCRQLRKRRRGRGLPRPPAVRGRGRRRLLAWSGRNRQRRLARGRSAPPRHPGGGSERLLDVASGSQS